MGTNDVKKMLDIDDVNKWNLIRHKWVHMHYDWTNHCGRLFMMKSKAWVVDGREGRRGKIRSSSNKLKDLILNSGNYKGLEINFSWYI